MTESRACFCIGPQPGQRLCPCELRNESAKDAQIRLLQTEVDHLRREQGCSVGQAHRRARHENGIERLARIRRVLDREPV